MTSIGDHLFCQTRSAELLFFHYEELQALASTAGCSAVLVVRAACALALQAYEMNESFDLLCTEKDQLWRVWNVQLPRDARVLSFLQDAELFDDAPADIEKQSTQRYGLSISELDSDLYVNGSQENLLDVQDLKGMSPNINILLTAKWDSISCGILLRCEYDHSMFSDWQARHILLTFRRVLKGIVLNPRSFLSELELADAGDYYQYNRRGNSVPQHNDTGIHGMIAKHFQQTPLSPAVDAWDGKLSYADLDEASNRIAYELVRLGVGCESTVALLFEKSVWNVVATVAVLKAGGAFVPLEPSQPDNRVSYILEQIKAQVVLTSKAFEGRLLPLFHQVIAIDQSWLGSKPNPPGWGGLTAKPWDLAYIMFTSGSTGEPKGVMIDHSACVASAVAHGRASGFNKETRTIQYARHTFDASIAEILTTLIFGGCVVVPSEDERLNNITLVMQQKRVNWAFFTPSLIRLLEPSELPGLKTLLLGGEPIGQDNIEKWAPRRKLINVYGPTENTVFSTMHLLPPSAKAGIIGRGVGTSCWIADPDDPTRLSPMGSVGELLLEGPQLARGYLNFAENEGPNRAFIRDPPWLTMQGRRARLYRTGDLCRFDENGVIHYEGRKDTQLKISGQRLEASEVELHLRKAFGTADVLVDVLPRPAQVSSPVLVAFVHLQRVDEAAEGDGMQIIPRQAPELHRLVPKVRDEISKSLPSWMWPAVYIPLSKMPLSPNGKIDAKRLREEVEGLTPEQFYSFAEGKTGGPVEGMTVLQTQQPETGRERLMKGLWAEVLGLPQDVLSPTSNFFRLGGDSLASIALVAAARRKGLQLEFAQVFKNPVLEDLCRLPLADFKSTNTPVQPFELIGGRTNMLDDMAAECSISPDEIEDAFPCTPLQEGLMALSSTTSKPFLVQYVLQLGASVDVERLKMAWESVASLHGIFRTRLVDTSTSGIHQVVMREKLTWNQSSNMDKYLEEDLAKPSGLGVPLNRYGIILDADGTVSHLVWTVHHAIADGHSVGLTFQAIRNAYNDALQPTNASFPSFIKYSRSMNQAAATQYWKSVFEGGDYESFPARPTHLASNTTDHEPAFVRRRLSLPSSTVGATATTILRAAWALVISRFSGSSDAVFGVTSSGRNAPFEAIEEVVGPTIATVPLRVSCQEQRTVRGLLEDLQASTVNMIPYEQIGIQNIARISAECKAACEFQSMMIVQPEVDMAMDGSPFMAFDRPQDLDKFNSHAIMIECHLGKDSVFINMNFDKEYLDSEQAERLVDYFEDALDFLVSDENRLLEELCRSPISKDMVQLKQWNASTPLVTEACIHHMFEKHAKSRPDEQAVCAWDGCLSFSELDSRAAQLARVLADLGVGPEKKVVYCLDKSVYTVISMLAILKAGGTMVPLDPAHPPERKSFLVESVSADVAMTSNAYASMFSEMQVQTLIVDAALFEKLDENNVEPFSSSEVRPNNAATVLFTSGSTGIPKGVVQEHRTLCSAATAHSTGMRMSEGSRILQFSAYVFDVSIIETINAFVLGACLCVPSDEDRMNDLAGFVSMSQADWAFFTPSFARTLHPGDLPSLKTVCMGGEAMTLDNIHAWAGRVELINAYGPCEGSVCTVAETSLEVLHPDSIGRGLNCLTWIVDSENHDKLLPIGSTGEILIEGPSVARGYLDDPEKTNQSFIGAPVWISHFDSDVSPRRMYKTGDLGRLNSDGSISYLGRKDHQIKLRGQRVEPGEVEHQILKLLPAGSVVAVDAVSVSGSTNKSLVAFVQNASRDDGSAEPRDSFDSISDRLKTQLSCVLPAYMVPSRFISVDCIPLGPTGKVDRRRLKELASALSCVGLSETESITRRDDNAMLGTDEQVALAISTKLSALLSGDDLQRAGSLRGHNFNPVHAGMDSIQVISLSNFIRKTYGVSLPIKRLMSSAATIRDIAEGIADGHRASSREETVRLLREIDFHDTSLSSIRTPGPERLNQRPLRTILLTGATGFLGNQLVAQILRRSEVSKLIVLVRGPTRQHASERFLSVARNSSWWDERYVERIEVWHGDLALPRLGLQQAQWSRLDGSCGDGLEVDAVIHNGAVVNWAADYRALEPANVLSTVHLLQATMQASRARPMRFTYVSGGHLSTSEDNVREISEELSMFPAYSQTKFVAEILVARCAERLSRAGCGDLVSIVKPGLIMGSSSDGISNTDDFLWRVTSSALDVGLYTDHGRDQWITAAGVDLVAQIVLDSCFQLHGQRSGVVRKILNGLTVGEYWDIVMEETGRAVTATDNKDWLRTLREDVESKGSTHKMWPVMHFLEENEGRLGQALGGMTANDRLEHQDVVKKALRKSLRYLVAIGYINASDSSSEDGDSGSERGLLFPGSIVFSRTPTTPVWEHIYAAHPKDNDGVKPKISITVSKVV